MGLFKSAEVVIDLQRRKASFEWTKFQAMLKARQDSELSEKAVMMTCEMVERMNYGKKYVFDKCTFIELDLFEKTNYEATRNPHLIAKAVIDWCKGNDYE